MNPHPDPDGRPAPAPPSPNPPPAAPNDGWLQRLRSSWSAGWNGLGALAAPTSPAVAPLATVAPQVAVAAAATPTPTPPRAPQADSLLGAALTEPALLAAWERVLANDGCAGVDGQTLRQFGQDPQGRLQQLRREVLSGQYCPLPLKRVEIPKPNARIRVLAIPAVRDRVLQTAVAQALTARLDPAFAQASYGYRSGRSVAQAIARVLRYRDAGLRHVVDADIEDFFGRIDHRLLLHKLREVTPGDAALHDMVALWLQAIVQDGARSWLLDRGVPQGSPLSPLLSNLYLDEFDDRLLAAGLPLVRYADDFVVLCRSAEAARQAMEQVAQALRALKLQLQPVKTRLTHFDQGFTFLGVRFAGPMVEAVEPESEPWLLPDERDARQAAQHAARQAVQSAAAGQPVLDPLPAADADAPRATQPSEAAPHRLLLDAVDGADAAFEAARAGDGPGPGKAWPALPATATWAHPAADDGADSSTLRLLGPGSAFGGGAGGGHGVGAASPLLPSAAPLLHTLYIGQPGCAVLKEGERITVTRRQEVLASVPFGQVDQVLIQANSVVSSALLLALAERRIGVCIAEPDGDGLLTLDRGALPDRERHALQLRRNRHAAFNLMVARGCVEGKLHNSKVLLRRFARRGQPGDPAADSRGEIAQSLRSIDDSLARLPYCTSLDTLRGLEGAAARAYFEGLRRLLPPEAGFTGRRRRPPRDIVNALLGYGYAVLAAQVQHFVRMEGLNAHFGHLHSTAPNSLALVSDLMEEFRPVVVDAVVLTLLREGRITAAHFEWEAGAELPCRLGPQARQTFVAALEAKLESRFIHPRLKRPLDYRRAIQAQVRSYLQVLERRVALYPPLKLK